MAVLVRVIVVVVIIVWRCRRIDVAMPPARSPYGGRSRVRVRAGVDLQGVRLGLLGYTMLLQLR